MTSPTLAWIGVGAYLKSLIVTATVPVEPAGATAQAAPPPPPVAAAGGEPAAPVAAGLGVAAPPQAASTKVRSRAGRSTNRRMGEVLQGVRNGRRGSTGSRPGTRAD